MTTLETVKTAIRQAFATIEYPGDHQLRGSDEGDEPFLVERAFKGKTDWRSLDFEFVDQAPEGLASALSFFSDETFHFYLPAYLIADIDGRLRRSDPVFHLTHGLRDFIEAGAHQPTTLWQAHVVRCREPQICDV